MCNTKRDSTKRESAKLDSAKRDNAERGSKPEPKWRSKRRHSIDPSFHERPSALQNGDVLSFRTVVLHGHFLGLVGIFHINENGGGEMTAWPSSSRREKTHRKSGAGAESAYDQRRYCAKVSERKSLRSYACRPPRRPGTPGRPGGNSHEFEAESFHDYQATRVDLHCGRLSQIP